MNTPEQLVIQSVSIADHYNEVYSLMEGLHQSERELYNKTAEWKDIADDYMRHIIDMQDFYTGTCLLAYIADAAVGFIFGYAMEQDESRILDHKGYELYISDGYVLPQYRRMGIYRQLNNRLQQEYVEKGVRYMTRYTLTSNIRMQRFLEAEGYVATRLLYEKFIAPDGSATEPIELTKPKD